VIYSGDLASKGDEKTLAVSVDVGTVASALVSSDTSYGPRISFFMRGMNLVLSNPRGEARLGCAGRSNLALTQNHDGLWTIVMALGEYQRTHSVA